MIFIRILDFEMHQTSCIFDAANYANSFPLNDDSNNKNTSNVAYNSNNNEQFAPINPSYRPNQNLSGFEYTYDRINLPTKNSDNKQRSTQKPSENKIPLMSSMNTDLNQGIDIL